MARRPRGDLLDAIGRAIESRAARAVLALLIVVSVLPFRELELSLRPLFLAVFGSELLLRVALLQSGRVERTRAELAFLLIDLIAFVSFLPLEHFIDPAERTVLRTLRLLRLLVLLRFTRELAFDVWSVLTRREQLSQFGLITTSVLGLTFVSAVLLSQLGVHHDYDHAPATVEDFWDRVWWSFRQVESPDNLVSNLRGHPLLVVVSLGLTIAGVFIFSYLIGVGANVVEQVVRAERRRPVPQREHTVVIGPSHEAEVLVREFVRIHDKNRAQWAERLRELVAWLVRAGPRPRARFQPKMALLGASEEPPGFLYEPRMRAVGYRQGDPSEPEGLRRIAATDAKRLVLLAEGASSTDADALTLTRLGAFRRDNPWAHAFVEVRESQNRHLVLAVGGEGTYPLDVPRFLGLFLAHHLLVPGVGPLFRELLTADGQELYTHLYADPEERADLARWADGDGLIPVSALCEMARREHGVALLGLFRGTDPLSEPAVPVEQLEPVLGLPAVGQGDAIPLSELRGFVAIAHTYGPLSRCARAALSVRPEPATPDPDEAVSAAIGGFRADPEPVQRLVVVGQSASLGALVHGLDRFVEGLDAQVLVRARGADPEALSALRRLGWLAPDAERLDGEPTPLPAGGRVRVDGAPEERLVDLVRDRVQRDSVQTLVFLADQRSADPDATTTLRALRFARALADADIDQRLHVLVELVSMHHAETLRAQLQADKLGLGRSQLRLTMVSTEQVRNYFLVHSAFVPGIHAVYDQLLGEPGVELVRLDPPPDLPADSAPTCAQIERALRARGMLLVALESRQGVRANPPPDARVPVKELTGLFVLAEASTVRATAR